MTGYTALKEKALKKGWSRSWSCKVYLLGYLMSWGISFRKDGESAYIVLCFQLHEGTEDDSLAWPFMKELKMILIHPDTQKEWHLSGKPSTNEAKRKCYFKPNGGRNRAVRFANTRVESSDIERDGYAKR